MRMNKEKFRNSIQTVYCNYRLRKIFLGISYSQDAVICFPLWSFELAKELR